MAADVQVKEIDILKLYSSKMNGLRNDSIALAIALDVQIHKIIEDYNKVLSEIERMLSSAESDCDFLVNRYNRAILLCGEEARPTIGNSDLEAQQKLELLRIQAESVRNTVRNLQMKLQNAGLKTQNYAAQMDTLANTCISYVNRYAEVLQQSENI